MMQRLLMGLVKTYRVLFSPWVGSACRFEPTCSAYSLQALQTHGAAKGAYLTLRRLARCHPWCAGGHDPVPKVNQQFLSQLTSSNVGKKTS
jgi:putative membrane protein insertion efficiency factor